MKPRLYVETTIVGYMANRVSRDAITAGHQEITRQWWSKRRRDFDLYCSELVIREASKGDQAQAKERLARLTGIPVLTIAPGVLVLARALLKNKAMPSRAVDDATHLAIAAVNGMQYLLTWNCAHLANASLGPFLERICKKAGYRCPIICTPEQLLEG